MYSTRNKSSEGVERSVRIKLSAEGAPLRRQEDIGIECCGEKTGTRVI